MSGTTALRAALTGLTAAAAAQEQQLLASAPAAQAGNPQQWAAAPLIAHNTEFRREQVVRLRAIRCGQNPPDFPAADHGSAELYAALAAQPRDAIAADSWRVAGELAAEIAAVADADLLDPSRHAWLRGRQLWLQIAVRGFWHPAGHAGEYYLRHGEPLAAVQLAELMAQTASAAGAPAEIRGMASYNLACALAGAERLAEAREAVAQAVELNSDLRENAARDDDLAVLRSA